MINEALTPDSGGRFERVTGPGLPGYVDPGTPGYGVQYGRLASSDLLETASYKSDVNTVLVSTQRDYEPNRDLIEWVDNKVGATTVSKYDYNASNDDLDALGRRTSVVYTGTAFAENHLFKWGYNNRSELVTADRHQGTTPDTPGTQYPQNGDYEFNYDHIGNRQTYGLDANPDTTYTANDLNQYAGTSNPTEAFAYDFDGNLITDGTRLYQWDAENRLIVVEPINPQANDKRVAFAYDYMGRRVRKQVFDWTGSAWSGTASADLRFVYDGWNVIMVLDGLNSNAVTRKYTWGLDLSGTIHGAGGIGGLLACEEPQTTGGPKKYWFMYDANGNVGQVLDATDTNSITIAAHYEYDAYGNVINNLSSYTYATANPFRFSTKWFDAETGLGYWGMRYYDPKRGRWTSEDPNEERGGLNLYAAMANSPVYWFDPDGAEATSQPAPNPQPPTQPASQPVLVPIVIDNPEDCSCACGRQGVKEIQAAASQGVTSVCKFLDRLLDPIDRDKRNLADFERYLKVNDRCRHIFETGRITRPYGYGRGYRIEPPNIEDIIGRLRTLRREACDPKAPRHFRCEQCGAGESKEVPDMKTGWWFGYSGQPITICVNAIDKNQCSTRMLSGCGTMFHELLRWYVGDTASDGWDNIADWDACFGCEGSRAWGWKPPY